VAKGPALHGPRSQFALTDGTSVLSEGRRIGPDNAGVVVLEFGRLSVPVLQEVRGPRVAMARRQVPGSNCVGLSPLAAAAGAFQRVDLEHFPLRGERGRRHGRRRDCGSTYRSHHVAPAGGRTAARRAARSPTRNVGRCASAACRFQSHGTWTARARLVCTQGPQPVHHAAG
jgi:hypothetical protein